MTLRYGDVAKMSTMMKSSATNKTAARDRKTPLGYMNTFVGVLLLVVVLIIAIPAIAATSSTEFGNSGDPVTDNLEQIGLYPKTFEAGLKAYRDGNQSRALRIWRPIAESGHTLAQYNMGVAYAQGLGVDRNLVEASKWWKRSALQGHRDSAYNLGLVYARGGKDVPRDLALAAHWWQQAANHGDAVAQYNLGMMYARGEGVKQNMETAIRWWQLSANQGFSGAKKVLDQVAADSMKFTGN